MSKLVRCVLMCSIHILKFGSSAVVCQIGLILARDVNIFSVECGVPLEFKVKILGPFALINELY